MEQRGIQLYPHASPSQSQIQPPISPRSHDICSGVPLACSPYPCSRLILPVLCLKILPPTTTLTEIFHPLANSFPTPAQLCGPVDSEPGSGRSGLTLPYQKHFWRLASINTVCAWRLRSKTALALHQRAFWRLKRSEKKILHHSSTKGLVQDRMSTVCNRLGCVKFVPTLRLA